MEDGTQRRAKQRRPNKEDNATRNPNRNPSSPTFQKSERTRTLRSARLGLTSWGRLTANIPRTSRGSCADLCASCLLLHVTLSFRAVHGLTRNEGAEKRSGYVLHLPSLSLSFTSGSNCFATLRRRRGRGRGRCPSRCRRRKRRTRQADAESGHCDSYLCVAHPRTSMIADKADKARSFKNSERASGA